MNTKIDRKQVMSLYHSGMNMRQIGEALGVSNSDICQFMIKYNINARSFGSKARGDKRVKLDKEQVISMYESGMSQSKIGKALGVSNACISKLMKKYGIKARKTGLGRPKKIGKKNE
jgi:DNA-directed RNA polymerase specialized sigma subunit